jgi:hypothetical protein
MNRTEGLHFLEHAAALRTARFESFAAGMAAGVLLTAVITALLVILR